MSEEITGIDLVQAQLNIAAGAKLADLGLQQKDIPAPRGTAIQARVNLETMQADGSVRSSGGVISVYEPPAGIGAFASTAMAMPAIALVNPRFGTPCSPR